MERMPIDPLFGDRCKGISISTVMDYPMKTLVFDSNCNFKILAVVLAKTITFLVDEGISYSLMISDHGKKIFLFLRVKYPIQYIPCFRRAILLSLLQSISICFSENLLRNLSFFCGCQTYAGTKVVRLLHFGMGVWRLLSVRV